MTHYIKQLLPPEITEIVQQYVSGTQDDWKQVNKLALQSILSFSVLYLRSPPYYRLGEYSMWCRLCIYCEYCGEKQKASIFSDDWLNIVCYYC